MKNRSLLIVVFVCLSLSGVAQTTGYLGKRFLINLDASIINAKNSVLIPDRSIGFDGKSEYFSFNCILSPNIEFVLADKWSVGTSFHTCKTFFNGNNAREVLYNSHFESLPLIGLNINGVGIFFKKYLYSKSHAPYGLYTKLQLDWLFINFDAYEYGQFSDQTYGAKIEFGYDYLFFDKLRISWGFSLGTTTNFLQIFDTRRGTLVDFANNKVMGMYTFSNKISIGFLAF
jgi:hypothetical protein